MRIPRCFRLGAVVLAGALLACGGGAADAPKPGHGVVRGVDAERGEVTIEHGDIPDLMKAMTMPFSVDDPSILAGIAVGDEVDFQVKQDGERYVVTGIRRAAE